MNQPRIFLSPPHLSGNEQAYLSEVFASNWIAPVGPQLAEFERRFAARLGLRYAVAVASGTAALHLALRRVGLKPGDEVLCSAFTFCASANPILYEHARPVFIDADAATWNIDPQLLDDELREASQQNRLPRAAVVVDLLGQSADMDPINEICGRYGIPVIEDAAEALGATYKDRAAGASGWCSAFSFNGNKIITTSGGGILCSNDEQLIEKARHWSTQAKDPGHLYFHSELGFNYRMSNVLAAIGLGQLDVLDDRIAARKRVNLFYQKHLADVPGIRFMPIAEYGEPNYWLSVIRCDAKRFGADVEAIRMALEAENIESRRVWVPLPQLPIYAGCRSRGGAVANAIFSESLCLPSGSALQTEDLERIVDVIRKCCRA
jgi:pyridoxal phosphate-dependent aminotransferase EpsN